MSPTEREQTFDALTEIVNLLHERARGRMDEHEPRYAEIRSKLLKSNFLAPASLEFLKVHRTLQTFWTHSAKHVPSYAEREKIVDDAIRPTWNLLESDFEPLVEISEDTLDALDMGKAKTIWRRATARLKDEPDGAVTLTRTLLETVCKKILSEVSEPFGNQDKLSHLCRRALAVVLPESVSGRASFPKFAQTTANLMDAITDYRNDVSDAHGSAAEIEIDIHHAEYAVNLAGATAVFLIECYRTKTARS